MAVPVLPLNLAPPPSLWRQRHTLLGWAALVLGLLVLVGALGKTWLAYHQASRAGRDAVSLTEETRRALKQEQQIQSSLQGMDATREQSRWKVAERILQERSLPWSRLTTELEQSLVPDMRLKAIQRTRSSGQQVVMKLKGEARTRPAEAAFIEALRDTPVFEQVILERESERPGGGWDFELSLPAAAVPPPFRARAPKVAKWSAEAHVPQPTPKPEPPPTAKIPVRLAPPPPQPAPALAPSSPEGIQARPAPTDDSEEGGRRPRPRLRDTRRPPS
jgi:hypothetical protein